MRRGISDSYQPSEMANDPLQFTPNYGEILGASFREASQVSTFRQGARRGFLEAGVGPGERVDIDQANEEYGLDLKPSFAKTISRSYAEFLSREKVQSEIDQGILQQGQPDFLTSLVAGVAASATDPAELLLGRLAPLTNIGKYAAFSAKAGRLVSPGAAARFLRRFPNQRTVTNPFLLGALEGGADAAMVSPMIYFNAQALGQEYTADDALIDVGASTFLGGALHAIPPAARSIYSRAVGNGHAPATYFSGPRVDPDMAEASASAQFSAGQKIDAYAHADTKKLIDELNTATEELHTKFTDSGPRPTVNEEAPVSPEPTRPVPEGDTSTAPVSTEPTRPAPSPQRQPAPIELETPEAVAHSTELERRLARVTDPAGYREEVRLYGESIVERVSKLAEILSMKDSDFLLHRTDAESIHSGILRDVQALNELGVEDFPLADQLDTTKKGLLSKKALEQLGRKITKLNDTVANGVPDTDKITLLRAEREKLQAGLKKAYKAKAELTTKGLGDPAKWERQISTDIPALQHVNKLLRALGDTEDVPELPLQQYIDSLGNTVSPKLMEFLEANQDLSMEPVYRIRRNIVSNVARRIQDTKAMIKNMHSPSGFQSKFKENDEILRAMEKELSERGAVDPDKAVELSINNIEAQIKEAEGLGILSDTELAQLEKINETFKADLEKTDAISKASLQAQFCTMAGVEKPGDI